MFTLEEARELHRMVSARVSSLEALLSERDRMAGDQTLRDRLKQMQECADKLDAFILVETRLKKAANAKS